MSGKPIYPLAMIRKAKRAGIELPTKDANQIGYWLRWGGQPRPSRKCPRQAGWDECDAELTHERKGRRDYARSGD